MVGDLVYIRTSVEDWRSFAEKLHEHSANQGLTSDATLPPSAYQDHGPEELSPREWAKRCDDSVDDTKRIDFLEPEDAPSNWTFDVDRLNVIRYLALLSAQSPAERGRTFRRAVYDWINFLIADSDRSFYLQTSRAADPVFFHRQTLRPRAQTAWRDGWPGKLPWLAQRGRARRLTVAELELCLVLFDWDADKPRFAWWVSQYPFILSKIHLFLLRRYCGTLLWAFRKARAEARKAKRRRPVPPEYKPAPGQAPKAADTDGAQGEYDLCRVGFSAGVCWWLYPRVWGLNFIGLLAVLSSEELAASFFPPGSDLLSLWIVVVLGVLGLGLLVIVDVFKQNARLLIAFAHALSRCVWLFGGLLWRGLACSLFAEFPLFIADRSELLDALAVPNGMAAGGYEWLHAVMGILARGVWVALIGALIQWFWEDKAATEPV